MFSSHCTGRLCGHLPRTAYTHLRCACFMYFVCLICILACKHLRKNRFISCILLYVMTTTASACVSCRLVRLFPMLSSAMPQSAQQLTCMRNTTSGCTQEHISEFVYASIAVDKITRAAVYTAAAHTMMCASKAVATIVNTRAAAFSAAANTMTLEVNQTATVTAVTIICNNCKSLTGLHLHPC